MKSLLRIFTTFGILSTVSFSVVCLGSVAVAQTNQPIQPNAPTSTESVPPMGTAVDVQPLESDIQSGGGGQTSGNGAIAENPAEAIAAPPLTREIIIRPDLVSPGGYDASQPDQPTQRLLLLNRQTRPQQ